MIEIVIASHNLHKIREFREMLKVFKHFDVLSLLNFPHYTLPEETGRTFEENATQKALDAAHVLNKWVLADDSGLVVPSLNGEPGIFSRRFAGEEATDAENRQKLLLKMKDFSDDKRWCYYECCLALASPEGIEKIAIGRCEGRITKGPKGRNGFGYDPLFVKSDYDKTFAEIKEEVKNLISHRRKAFEKLSVILEGLT
ncbi:MAG TPA: RdgB/HAM1 family non-canonical purine NTP pyrophosphatase [Parachlamydiaceae bacterium]|nr:RdgB/HAM1 family non-canonical purine NTP pyrophosphatase [Parachlamydiaceae bacterium]